ncbi:hypothetical protein CGC20_2305 [Leishmania donovani]|uniref:Uncharacterized protein n=1 Tax=Leishmania donovani TaxID=5661 RepID=A0A504XZ94_LEIDO|nr:hypothetical protein CGC20_2305 [Leishmania donovani]
MDVIPPEYDPVTRERVYRQEWLEYFHYIGFEAAIRDYPAEYRALFPRGHHKPPAMPPPLPVGGTKSQKASTSATAANMFIADDDDKEVGKGSETEDDWSSLISSSSSSAASTPRDAPREDARAENVERTARDERSSRRQTSSRHDDRHHSSRRHRDRDSDERRRRHHSDEEERRHRHRHHSSRGSDYHHSTSSGTSRRRRRSGDRDNREDRRSSRVYSSEESSRRYRRETTSGSSRTHAYEDRREDALRPVAEHGLFVYGQASRRLTSAALQADYAGSRLHTMSFNDLGKGGSPAHVVQVSEECTHRLEGPARARCRETKRVLAWGEWRRVWEDMDAAASPQGGNSVCRLILVAASTAERTDAPQLQVAPHLGTGSLACLVQRTSDYQRRPMPLPAIVPEEGGAALRAADMIERCSCRSCVAGCVHSGYMAGVYLDCSPWLCVLCNVGGVADRKALRPEAMQAQAAGPVIQAACRLKVTVNRDEAELGTWQLSNPSVLAMSAAQGRSRRDGSCSRSRPVCVGHAAQVGRSEHNMAQQAADNDRAPRGAFALFVWNCKGRLMHRRTETRSSPSSRWKVCRDAVALACATVACAISPWWGDIEPLSMSPAGVRRLGLRMVPELFTAVHECRVTAEKRADENLLRSVRQPQATCAGRPQPRSPPPESACAEDGDGVAQVVSAVCGRAGSGGVPRVTAAVSSRTADTDAPSTLWTGGGGAE